MHYPPKARNMDLNTSLSTNIDTNSRKPRPKLRQKTNAHLDIARLARKDMKPSVIRVKRGHRRLKERCSLLVLLLVPVLPLPFLPLGVEAGLFQPERDVCGVSSRTHADRELRTDRDGARTTRRGRAAAGARTKGCF